MREVVTAEGSQRTREKTKARDKPQGRGECVEDGGKPGGGRRRVRRACVIVNGSMVSPGASDENYR